MSHNILITGGSGYLGGTVLARLRSASLPPYNTLYALVRSDNQAKAVAQYGARPLIFNVRDEDSVLAAVTGNDITIVYFLIDAFQATAQKYFIRALAEVKQKTGLDVHFFHTSGAKLFSSHAGAPTNRILLDSDPRLYDIQKSQRAEIKLAQTALEGNCAIVEECETHGVRGYIFIPCIVYGKGEGFGNPISIQTTTIVRAAKDVGRVYRVDSDRPIWPVCHIIDTANLYIELLRNILAGENPGHNKQGYYLAASGSVVWDDLYAAMARALAKRNVIADDSVKLADDEALSEMAAALGCPREMVPVSIGGKCTLTAERGAKIGWRPQYPPEHAIDMADAEVEIILKSLES